jgi:hypothetical protein
MGWSESSNGDYHQFPHQKIYGSSLFGRQIIPDNPSHFWANPRPQKTQAPTLEHKKLLFMDANFALAPSGWEDRFRPLFSKNPPRLFHGLPGLQNLQNLEKHIFPQGFGQWKQKHHVDLGLLKQGELMIFLLVPLIPMNTIAAVISPINNSWPTSKPIFLFLPFPFCRYIRGHCPGFSENWSRPIESLLTPFLKIPKK